MISRTFSKKNGSLDSLSVFEGCGLTPNSANQRYTVLLETCSAQSSRRALHGPESSGLVCSARWPTAPPCAS